jgi:hypothetical protein
MGRFALRSFAASERSGAEAAADMPSRSLRAGIVRCERTGGRVYADLDRTFYDAAMVRRSQRTANVAYYRRNRELEIARVRVRQQRTVAMLRELRDRPCMDCGGRFAPHQMDFDHRNGTTKRFRVTSGGAMLRPTRVLLDEVAKCDVVCANCHRIRNVATASGPTECLAWELSASGSEACLVEGAGRVTRPIPRCPVRRLRRPILAVRTGLRSS